MKRAQQQMEAALAHSDVDEKTKNAYLKEVKRYFTAFEQEARAHLRAVDKRLDHINQVHFNLTAERGTAVRRIEATRGVLRDIERVSGS